MVSASILPHSPPRTVHAPLVHRGRGGLHWGGLFQCLAVGQHPAGGTRVIHDHYAYRLLLVPPIYEAFMLIFFFFLGLA